MKRGKELDQSPDGAAIAELLRERYAIDRRFEIGVDAEDSPHGLRVVVRIDRPAKGKTPADRFTVDVTKLRGGGSGWDLVIDAADALVGTLVESDYAHRALPQGSDVEYQDGVFRVEVTRERPDVDRRADALLDSN